MTYWEISTRRWSNQENIVLINLEIQMQDSQILSSICCSIFTMKYYSSLDLKLQFLVQIRVHIEIHFECTFEWKFWLFFGQKSWMSDGTSDHRDKSWECIMHLREHSSHKRFTLCTICHFFFATALGNISFTNNLFVIQSDPKATLKKLLRIHKSSGKVGPLLFRSFCHNVYKCDKNV